MTNQSGNQVIANNNEAVSGFIVIASVSKDVVLPLETAESLYQEFGFSDHFPKEKKLSAIWEKSTNISTVPRKDITFSPLYANEGLKVRFYTSKIKGELGQDGKMTRHLVMEVINPNQNAENKLDIEWESDAKVIADKQRVNKPISIMKFDRNDEDKKIRFFWSDYGAKDGYGYLEYGETAKIIGEIKSRIELESGNLTNREIWKSCKNILGDMAAYPLTSRGSAYFVPTSGTSQETRKTLKNFMDLVNSFKTHGRSSCTIWQVYSNPKDDEFGSASEVLGNALLELSDRIEIFAQDLSANKRETTLRKEWSEITKHIALFRGILGDKLGKIENSLTGAIKNLQASQYEFNIPSEISEVLETLGDTDIEVPELELLEDKEELPPVELDSFEMPELEF